MANSIAGKVQTVQGPIDPSEVGITTTHEHLLIDFICVLQELPGASNQHRMHEPVNIENLWWVRHYWNSSIDNLQMFDVDIAAEEASEFYKAGGSTIVDVTSIGIGRDPLALLRISRATGLNVVMGGGHYVYLTHSENVHNATVEELTELIIGDVQQGVDGTGVKTGIIGEIGNSWPWEDSEKKTLEAAVMAQRATGAPLLIHPGRDDRSPIQLLDAVDRWGGDLSKTVMGHIERTIFDNAVLDEVAATGAFMNWDLWGNETTYYPMNAQTYMASDQHRIEQVEYVIANGNMNQVLMAHDICAKHRLKKWGGHGWDYIVDRVVPRFRARGTSQQQIDTMLIDNPTRMLTFAEPSN